MVFATQSLLTSMPNARVGKAHEAFYGNVIVSGRQDHAHSLLHDALATLLSHCMRYCALIRCVFTAPLCSLGWRVTSADTPVRALTVFIDCTSSEH